MDNFKFILLLYRFSKMIKHMHHYERKVKEIITMLACFFLRIVGHNSNKVSENSGIE